MSELIECMLCHRMLERVSGRHLSVVHKIDIFEYWRLFPDAPTVSGGLGQCFSDAGAKSAGHAMSVEGSEAISAANTGKHPSEETLQKLSDNANLIWTTKRDEIVAKHIEWWRDPNNWERMSKVHLGKVLDMPLKGPQSEETKQKMRHTQKDHFKDPEHAKRIFEATITARSRRPNDTEILLWSILNKYFPGIFEYVGDGKVWIGGRNPDFVDVVNRRLVIEMFGYKWHCEDEVTSRMVHFEEYGYTCLVFWEDTVNYDEDKIVREVKELLKESKNGN